MTHKHSVSRTAASGMFEFVINGVITERIMNRIMDAVLNSHADTLVGTTPNIEIKYVAFGTGTTAVTNTDTKLANETFRFPVTSKSRTATGKIESVFNVLKTEGNGTIDEIGIVGGSAASGTKDTGTLLARVLWHHVKTSSEELQIRRTDLIGRV